MLNEEKQIKYSKYMLYIFVLAAICCAACCLLSREGLHGDRYGADGIGTKFRQAVGNQQSISSGIADSEKSAANVGAGIDRGQAAEQEAAAAIGRAENLVEESGRLAAENAAIIKTIRARGVAGSGDQS